MKTLVSTVILILSICFVSNLSAQQKYTHSQGYATVDPNRTAMTNMEKDMIKEINLVRTNPKGYVAHIKTYMNTVMYPQEKATAEELIAELEKLTPMGALKEANCLFLAARDHAVNQAPTGGLEHQDTNKKDPWDRVYAACSSIFAEHYKNAEGYSVPAGNENLEGSAGSDPNKPNNARNANINLLIDHGVTNRGHRRNILNPVWTHAAAITYQDKVGSSYWHRWIQKFGMDKNSKHAVSAGSSGSSGGQASVPKNKPADCPEYTRSMNMSGGKYYIDDKEVSKECYNWTMAQ